MALEPDGPPFGTATAPIDEAKKFTSIDYDPSIREYGLADIPMGLTNPWKKRPWRYSTPFRLEKVDLPDQRGAIIVQSKLKGKPVRSFANLTQIPVLVMTSQCGFHATYDRATVDFMSQAGIKADWIRLDDFHQTGNGHFMMMENNNADIFGILHAWLVRNINGIHDPNGQELQDMVGWPALMSSVAMEQARRVAGYSIKGENRLTDDTLVNTTEPDDRSQSSTKKSKQDRKQGSNKSSVINALSQAPRQKIQLHARASQPTPVSTENIPELSNPPLSGGSEPSQISNSMAITEFMEQLNAAMHQIDWCKHDWTINWSLNDIDSQNMHAGLSEAANPMTQAAPELGTYFQTSQAIEVG